MFQVFFKFFSSFSQVFSIKTDLADVSRFFQGFSSFQVFSSYSTKTQFVASEPELGLPPCELDNLSFSSFSSFFKCF